MPVDETEHQRLLRITAELEREHEGLKMAPNDLEAHATHETSCGITSKSCRPTFSD